MANEVNNDKIALGIAFASNRINAVWLNITDGKLNLSDAFEEFYSEEMNVSHQQWRKKVVEKIMKRNDADNLELRFCIPHRQAFSKKLSINGHEEVDTGEWLGWAVRKYLPDNQEEMIFSFNRLGDESNHRREYYAQIMPKTVLAAAPSEAARISPLTDVPAEFYAVRHMGNLSEKRIAIIMNIDGHNCAYSVIAGGNFIDAWKFDGNGKPEKELAADIVTEIKIVLNSILQNGFNPDDNAIYLCGDITPESKLKENLISVIAGDTHLARPFDNLEISDNIGSIDNFKENQHRFAAAFGAALSIIYGLVENTKHELSSLPQQK